MNSMKTATTKVVMGFDVNILVSCCLTGMLSSVFGLRNTQQMNASLNRVRFRIFPIKTKKFLITILQADQKLTGLCTSISMHTDRTRRLLTTYVSIAYVYILSMLGKQFSERWKILNKKNVHTKSHWIPLSYRYLGLRAARRQASTGSSKCGYSFY